MNIFYLSRSPEEAARWHVDAHVVKMIIETAQLLSTAHRYHDGVPTLVTLFDAEGKPLKKRVVPLLPHESNARFEQTADGIKLIVDNKQCCFASHEKHPSTAWLISGAGYSWTVELLHALHAEFKARYGHDHQAYTSWAPFISAKPRNMPSVAFTPPPQAMPEVYKRDDSLEAYRRYYIGDKYRFAKWRGSEAPRWFIDGLEDVWKDTMLAERLAYIQDPKKRLKVDQKILDQAAFLYPESSE